MLKIKEEKVGKKMTDDEIVEITFHGRGGQTAITASQLLAQLAFEKGFKDTIAIPIIGAERRGAPIMAFTKVSKNSPIKTYDSVVNPDYIFIFDTSLLDIPKVRSTIKEGTKLIVNSAKPIDISGFPKDIKLFIVDATGICIKHKFMHSSGPILNVPMLGAFGSITGYYDLEIMKKVFEDQFGKAKLERNLAVAKDAFESVQEVKDV
ncbi:MAG: pyruvate ferredoxin oxidoreductase [Candidatus Lokiarchaeota archaeon]|nr:pyruvate ferredoxin oxidoreductase [Candidatus Lokiarchaeota archaeon]MBD3339829.1 pyruvate ferredoxin oxidoreductase [Candidatus Lokiarchaeota archaeon]